MRETHIVTAETLTSLEHQGLFMPLPYNRVKTGLPYFKKELFQLYPETSLLSKTSDERDDIINKNSFPFDKNCVNPVELSCMKGFIIKFRLL